MPASIPAVAQVLHDGLELPAGVTLLIGENGSGKSTLTMHGYFTRQESFRSRGDPLFHEMSHGESFLEILRTRFDSPGLYCLDEPEAALSFSAQIALVALLHDLAAAGGQVLCATHSPLLAAIPGARILEVGPWGFREVAWEELELVAHWRSYLDAPMRYLRHVVESD